MLSSACRFRSVSILECVGYIRVMLRRNLCGFTSSAYRSDVYGSIVECVQVGCAASMASCDPATSTIEEVTN